MATLKILLFPDPKLRTVAKPVEKIDDSIVKLTENMLQTMYEGSGIGLAATQVDVHIRVIVIDISDEKNSPLVLINPKIDKIIDSQQKSYSEGCLSVPGIYEELKRPGTVEISALNVEGNKFTLIAEGLLSVVIQHEMDHLEGRMMVDSLSNLKREIIRKKMIKLKASN
ncbi:MAG: peptide deformylase [Gammaproteobacteria bacterium]|jgi:peptide deformylase|nr:peptide deformylase [Gammaproteobacteria bacterium]HJL96362.1 peptide deformylase [SAR86 cluster bacterium]|tara:strand:+ start:10600 stop:11106 length:507 start_codon:yes stop_codon:yes gene_type:complete